MRQNRKSGERLKEADENLKGEKYVRKLNMRRVLARESKNK